MPNINSFTLPTLENISSLNSAVRNINYNDTTTLAYYAKLMVYSQILIGGIKARQEQYNKQVEDYYTKQKRDLKILLAESREKLGVEYSDETDKNGNPIIIIDHGPPLELLDYFETTKEARDRQEELIKWNNIKKDNKPFIGNKRTHDFPKVGEPITAHTVDQSIADRVVWETYGPSELALSTDQKDYTYSYNNNDSLSSEPGVEKLYKAWFVNGKPWGHKIPSQPFLQQENDRLREVDKAAKGSFKFFIEKLHGRGSKGPYKAGVIKSNGTFDQFPNRMVFPAYILRINDSFATNSEEYEFSGRSEKVYAYKNTTRTINLEFIVLADFSAELLALGTQAQEEAAKNGFLGQAGDNGNTESFNANNNVSGTNNFFPQLQSLITGKSSSLSDGEKLKEYVPLDWGDGSNSLYRYTDSGERVGFIPGEMSGTPEMLWERANFITQCCYPWYRNDGKLKEAPFIRLRITDFHDVICKVDSFNLDYEDFEIDLNPSTLGNIPLGIKVTLGLTVIHSEEPSSDYFKFFHRKDFDALPSNSKSNSNTRKENSKSGDEFLDEVKINSPLTFKTPDLLSGGNGIGVPNWVNEYTNSLNEFSNNLSSLSTLNNVGSLLTKQKAIDFSSKKMLEKALKAAKKLTDLRSLKEAYDYFKADDLSNLPNNVATSINNSNKKPNDVENVLNRLNKSKLIVKKNEI